MGTLVVTSAFDIAATEYFTDGQSYKAVVSLEQEIMVRDFPVEQAWRERLLRACSLTALLAAIAAPARAENPDHMRQLLSTGDCPGCDLSGANLGQQNLTEANLEAADLSGANLSNAQLLRANLQNANLQNARLIATDLTGANLQNADLSSVSTLFFCDPEGFYEEETTPECISQILVFQLGADLCDDDYGLSEPFEILELGTANFCDEEGGIDALDSYLPYYAAYQSFLLTPTFTAANLSGATLTNADFSGADFAYAQLTDANAAGADFSYAMLMDAETSGLKNADLALAWQSRQEVGEWLNENYRTASERARQTEGRTYVGAMGRAQQAYHLEMGAFSDEFAPLGIGIAEESDYYRFGVLPQNRSDLVLQYALSKEDDLHSYLSIVSLETIPESDELTTRTLLCESDKVGEMSLADVPATIERDDSQVSCPTGWSLLN